MSLIKHGGCLHAHTFSWLVVLGWGSVLCLVVYLVLRAAFSFLFFSLPLFLPKQGRFTKTCCWFKYNSCLSACGIGFVTSTRTFQENPLSVNLVLITPATVQAARKAQRWWALFCVCVCVFWQFCYIMFCFLWAQGWPCASFGFPLYVVKRVPLKADISLLLDVILPTHIIKFVHRLGVFNLYKSTV